MRSGPILGGQIKQAAHRVGGSLSQKRFQRTGCGENDDQQSAVELAVVSPPSTHACHSTMFHRCGTVDYGIVPERFLPAPGCDLTLEHYLTDDLLETVTANQV